MKFTRRITVRSPISSASKIQSVLLAKDADIRRRLVDDFGLKAHKPAKKTRLTPAMKVKRLAVLPSYTKNGLSNMGNRFYFWMNLRYSSSLHASGLTVDPLESCFVNGTPHKL